MTTLSEAVKGDSEEPQPPRELAAEVADSLPSLSGGKGLSLVGAAPRAHETEGVEFLATRTRALIREASLFACQKEAMLTLPDDHVTEVLRDFCEGVLLPAAKRQAVIHVVLGDGATREQAGRELLMSMSASGVVLRRSQQTLPDIAVFGRRLAIWRASGNAPGWLCSNDPRPVNNALTVFRTVWRAAEPLGLPEAETLLSDFERKILSHLVNGAKDERAARALNVSPRTYRRHVTAICERLGAGSRFEAGAKAARYGWITEPGLPN